MLTFQSWSGGKDSTASIILEHIYGLPQSKIIMSEVMFDRKRNISGELPEHIEWVHSTAIPLFQSWGYDIEILHSDYDYIDLFYHIRHNSKNPNRNGKYNGFLIGGRCMANNYIKVRALEKFFRKVNQEHIKYVGIAIDEPKRLERLNGTNKVSLLKRYGYTKQMSFDLCKEYRLLSPIYDFSKRGGCWFCPSATIKEYAHTKQNYPELWEELRKLSLSDNLVSQGFKYGKTFDEVDKEVDIYLNNLKFDETQLTLEDINNNV